MICPKCGDKMYYESPWYKGDVPSFKCVMCGDRHWFWDNIEKPMTKEQWKARAKKAREDGPRVVGDREYVTNSCTHDDIMEIVYARVKKVQS